MRAFPCIFTFSTQGSMLPFRPGNDPTKRGPFVDLREHPEHVDQLPEVIRQPHLKRILLLLNDSKSLFRTIGCNFEIKENEQLSIDAPFGKSEERPFVATSYLQMMFVDLARAHDLDLLFVVAGRILHYLSDTLPSAERLHLNVTFAFEELLKDWEPAGYMLNFRCRTAGDSEETASKRWGLLMSTIAESFGTKDDEGMSDFVT
jgi:hypothetical protein